MKTYKKMSKNINVLREWTQFILVFSLLVVLLSACVQSSPTSVPGSVIDPTPRQTQTATTPSVNTEDVVIAEAKSELANKLDLTTDVPHLIKIESVQWPDSCLGVQESGIMCAMHVVDGYRILLSVNGLIYAVHSNLDGSQLVVVPNLIPEPAGISSTIDSSDLCQTFLFTENEDVKIASCNNLPEVVPFVEMIREKELRHYIDTYQSFSVALPNGFMNFLGRGDKEASDAEQRSVIAWVQLVSAETLAGRSSASEGMILSWHREGGIAGFCDDLVIYQTGAANVTSCKNGQPKDLGQIWLDKDQLTQIYQWYDHFGNFEYAPQTNAQADGMTIDLVFAGSGSTNAVDNEQQTIETFVERIYAQTMKTPQ
ncbi:MAG: hypothetical protein CL609_01050 [Anaerolineaceae bacterium]|nr:hypothetical protein [Anaerolineaceae bacterium]